MFHFSYNKKIWTCWDGLYINNEKQHAEFGKNGQQKRQKHGTLMYKILKIITQNSAGCSL